MESHQTSTVLALANKHLKVEATSIDDLSITNISGLSNITLLVSAKSNTSNKVVIRFFMSNASDFELEELIFRKLGEDGVGPKELEYGEGYRVEEYINGRPLSTLEMRSPLVLEEMMKVLAEINYDEDIMALIRKLNTDGGNFSSRCIYNPVKGWYMSEVRPVLLSSEVCQSNLRAINIFLYFEKLVTEEKKLLGEIEWLMEGLSTPGREAIDFVASHNDFQPNNMLVWHEDKTKYTIIDFEYCAVNYRAYDIAIYFSENFYDYTHPVKPNFRLYEEQYIRFLFEGKESGSELERVLILYLKRYHQLRDGKPEYLYSGEEKRMLEVELPIIKDQFYRCTVMAHFQWSFWALLMMPYKRFNTQEGIEECLNFYLEFAFSRMQLHQKLKHLLFPERFPKQ